MICTFTFRSVISVADPGSGAFLTPGSGMGKKSGSGSKMNNPDYISERLETLFWIKILKNSLMRIRDLGWKKFGSGIRIRNTVSYYVIFSQKFGRCGRIYGRLGTRGTAQQCARTTGERVGKERTSVSLKRLGHEIDFKRACQKIVSSRPK